MKKANLIFALLFLFFSNSYSQINLNLGIDKEFIFTDKALFYVDFNTGNIDVVIPLKEKGFHATLNKKENVLYILSQHYIFKANASNGEIIGEYQYAKILEKTTADSIDPNMLYGPTTISKNGIALYTYNEKYRQLLRPVNTKNLAAKDLENTLKKIKERGAESIIQMQIAHYFIVDYKNKSVKPFAVIDQRNVDLIADNKIKKMISENISANYTLPKKVSSTKPKQKTTYNYNLDNIEQLKGKKIRSQYPRVFNDTQYYVQVMTMTGVKFEVFSVFFDKITSKVLHVFENNYASLAMINCKKEWYGVKEIMVKRENPKMPKAPVPPIDLRKKKVRKAYMAKAELYSKQIAEYSKKFNEVNRWNSEQAKKPGKVLVYDNLELLNPIFEYENERTSGIGGYSLVYNDKYLLNRPLPSIVSPYTMYSLATGEIIYTIDLDF